LGCRRRRGGGDCAGEGLSEDAAAAADIEVAEGVSGGWGGRTRSGQGLGQAGGDEVVAEGVHEMKDARGADGIPPAAGEGGEMREFICGDGGGGMSAGSVEAAEEGDERAK
jgi:hypothetical protein